MQITNGNDKWESYSIDQGRIGIFKNGICQKVVSSEIEVLPWLNNRGIYSFEQKAERAKILNRAIWRL